MRGNSQLKSGIILNYINIAVGNVFPFFYTPIMLSLLGKEEYGLYKLSTSVTSYLSLISFGFGAAITRYLIKASTEGGKEAEEEMLGLFVRVFRVIAGTALLIGVFLSLNLHLWYGDSLSAEELAKMKILVLIMSLNTSLSFSLAPYLSVVNTHEKFLFIQLMNIASTCLGPVFNLIVLFLGYASIGMAMTSLSVSLLYRAFFYLYVRKQLQIRPRHIRASRQLLKEIMAFSFWIFVANVVGQLYNATDTVMIGTVPALATAGVAVYNVGVLFNGMVFSLTTGISALMGPKTNKLVFSGADPKELTNLAIKVGRLQGHLFSLVVTGFIIFGRPFIRFYAGEEYDQAYWVAILTMIPNMIPLVQSVCLSIIVAQNKHRFRSLVYLGIAILNVIGTWFLMHTSLGIVGAALMTGIAVVIGQGFAMNWYYSKKTNIQLARFWKEVFPVYLVPSLLCVAALLLGTLIDYSSIPVFLVGVVIYSAADLVLNWNWFLNDYEKSLLISFLHVVRRRVKNNG